MKHFRMLNADEIECRVQKCTQKGVSILLYKTARTDADLLDETVGVANWENDFKLVDGVLYGGIGVDYGNGVVWKWDAGTESNTEAEKGRASDAFKRAGFKHGIGRELYSAPFIWIPADKCNITERNGKYACYDDFKVSDIKYDKERITALTICVGGKPVYTFGSAPRAKQKEPDKAFVCESCGKPIPVYTDGNGKKVYPAKWEDASRKKYGKCLCLDCMKEEK